MQEADRLNELRNEQLSDFPLDKEVTCRFMPGSQGKVIDVQDQQSLIIGPRFKVRWSKHKYLPDGETEESGWLSHSELKAL